MNKIISRIYGKLFLKHFNKYRRKRLTCNDFTIISNNCWGGIVYQYLGLQYNSPTIGLYFFSDEYIKFLKNIKYYLSLDIEFICIQDSKYRDELIKRNHQDKLIGKLDDIEIVFLHYKTKDEVVEKWKRRTKRINWDKLIIKFNDQNLCTKENVIEFEKLFFSNKIFFTANPNYLINSSIYMDMFEKDGFVKDDTTLYNFIQYIDIIKYINNI